MSRSILTLILCCWCVGACATPDPVPQEARFKYQHSFEFMWKEAKATLASKWKLESEDETLHELVSGFDTQLAPMSAMGRRNRLKVKLGGDMAAGYVVTATQESETNTNERNPLSMEDASWSVVENDGGLALQFLIDYERRINPPKTWQEQERR